MDFFNTVSVKEGREILMKNFEDYDFKTEHVDLEYSINRVLGEDIYSNINVPEFNRSTVDGYAIRVEDSHGASQSIPSIINILGEVMMGEEINSSIKGGESFYVPTGGMIPEGSDGVVMVENVEKMDSSTLLIYKPISQGENISYKGDDIKKGELILEKGRKITTGAIGVLAALGIPKVCVYCRPRFYIISTGDEIIGIEDELTLGKIRDINSYTLGSLVHNVGGIVVGRKIVRDNYELLRNEVKKAIDISDIVLLSGGSSVGTRDYTAKVIDSFGGKGVLFHGLAVKPGKPTIVGEADGKLICGLPGHPISSIIVFKALLEYYIRKKMGIAEIIPRVKAIMDHNFRSDPGKETYQMIELRQEGGDFHGTPAFGKSGMISLLSKSQGYIIIGSHEEGIYKGEEREVYLLQ
ncbi:MAG: molybdopterin molybdotransferase MoeA [Candidatus Alkaliphilus sp. MAG34]|nr:molybdopterin molybdotransferase MoeA [Clostridiales bacterium]